MAADPSIDAAAVPRQFLVRMRSLYDADAAEDRDLSWVTGPTLRAALRRRVPGGIPNGAARCLHDLTLGLRPERTLEVGLGEGTSALSILQALSTLGSGRHLCVELSPEECPGLTRLRRAGMRHMVELRSGAAHLVLPELVREGVRVQLAFLDGRHLFDYLMVDLFYADLLVEAGGLVVVDDVFFPGVAAAVDYVITNRAYRRIECPSRRLAVLHKTADDARSTMPNDARLAYWFKQFSVDEGCSRRPTTDSA